MNPLLKPLDDGFEIRFASLFKEGRSMAFPCDASGRVEVDALPPTARNNYFFARAMVGKEYSVPEVFSQAPARQLQPLLES